jgi:HK97 family phage prohead protease
MKDVYSYKGCGISEECPMSFKDIDGRKGIITGYFAMFNSVDGDGDVIRKGAFERTIREQGPTSSKPRIKHLLNHDPNQPLGVIYELKEDAIGLYYESKLGIHALGTDFVKMVDSGLVTENSFGYQTKKYNQVKPWSEWKEGETARELLELKVWEGSNLSAWGANWRTYNSSVKSEKFVDQLNQRIDLLIKALRSGTFTDDTFDLLEIELKQLQQVFVDLSNKEVVQAGPEPVQAAQAQVKSRNMQAIALTEFLN